MTTKETEVRILLSKMYDETRLMITKEKDTTLNKYATDIVKLFSIQGVVKSLNSSLQIGDDVLYVGKYLGTIVKDRNVELRDGTLIASLDTQPHKFRKVI